MNFEPLESRLQMSTASNSPLLPDEQAGSSTGAAILATHSLTAVVPDSASIDLSLHRVRNHYTRNDGISFDVNVANVSHTPVINAGLLVELVPANSTEPLARTVLLLGSIDSFSTAQLHVGGFPADDLNAGSYRLLVRAISLVADRQFRHEVVISQPFTLSAKDEDRQEKLARDREQRYLESRVAYAMSDAVSSGDDLIAAIGAQRLAIVEMQERLWKHVDQPHDAGPLVSTASKQIRVTVNAGAAAGSRKEAPLTLMESMSQNTIDSIREAFAAAVRDESRHVAGQDLVGKGTSTLFAQNPDGSSKSASSVASGSVTIMQMRGIVKVRDASQSNWQFVAQGMQLRRGAELNVGPFSSVVVRSDLGVDKVLTRLGACRVADILDGKPVQDGFRHGKSRYDIESAGREHDAQVTSPAQVLAVQG